MQGLQKLLDELSVHSPAYFIVLCASAKTISQTTSIPPLLQTLSFPLIDSSTEIVNDHIDNVINGEHHVRCLTGDHVCDIPFSTDIAPF